MIQLVEIKISFLRKHFGRIAISKSMIYVMVKIFTISRSNNDGPLSVHCIFFNIAGIGAGVVVVVSIQELIARHNYYY